MKKTIAAFVVVGFGFLLGFIPQLGNKSSVERNPAAVKKGFDISHLKGEALNKAVKERVLTGLAVRRLDRGVALSLGNFAYQNENGQRRLACEDFSKVSFVFEAEGMSVGGDKPIFELSGLCSVSDDLSAINPLILPIPEILAAPPKDGELRFNDAGVSVFFKHIADAWPRLWLLKRVKLLNEQEAVSIVIESDEVARVVGHPVVVNW